MFRNAGLLDRVWNAEGLVQAGLPEVYPTVGELRATKRNLFILHDVAPAHFNASDFASANDTVVCGGFETSTGFVPPHQCVEGWDAPTFEVLSPSRAVHRYPPTCNAFFLIPSLSSRRGRADHPPSMDYWPLPNLLADLPYQFGGNPMQAAQGSGAEHILGLEKAFRLLRGAYGCGPPNSLIVDFFNTTAPVWPNTLLRANPQEGLIAAAQTINEERLRSKVAQGLC
jgi:hypothetical protein